MRTETAGPFSFTLRALLMAVTAAGLLGLPAVTAEATPTKDGTSLLTSTKARELEVRIWTADEHELPELEREAVRMLQIDPRSSEAHYLLSHALVRQFSKDPSDLYVLKQASDLAQQAVDLDPRSAAGFVALAEILDLMGNPERAIRLLTEAESAGLEPNWRFYLARARLTADQSGTDKVLGLLETALAFTDAEPRIIVPYVVAVLQTEATGEALRAKLADWNARFPSPLFDLTMAITEAELGRFQQAHALYTKIIKTDPTNKEAKVNDAIILYRDLHDVAQGVTILEGVLAEHADEMTTPVRAMVTAHLGAAHLAAKAYEQAEGTFLKAVHLDPESPTLLDFVTRAYKDTKEHARLVSLIRRINGQVRGQGVLYALLGETLSESLDKHDDALKAFSDAITLEPDRSDYYNGMGLTFYRKKSYDQALKLFTAATEVDPNDATARYNEACVLSLLGRTDESLATLTEALTLDPRLVQSARGDADFARIKDSLRFRELVQEPAAEELPVGH